MRRRLLVDRRFFLTIVFDKTEQAQLSMNALARRSLRLDELVEVEWFRCRYASSVL
jgi:hypothetical protein